MSDTLVQRLRQAVIIPVIVIESVEYALALGKILTQHLPIAEITLRSPAAIDALKAMKTHFPELCVGAGTVLNAAQLAKAQAAGADFVVSPGCNLETIREAQHQGIPIIPGVNNPTAIEMALEAGLQTLKFFPAEASGGIKMINALLSPYQDIEFMPTGGIGQDNILQYLAIDRVIACGLSWMVEPTLLKNQDWQTVENRIIHLKKLIQHTH